VTPHPLSPPRQVKCANAHTIWVEWDPPKKDCRERPVDPKSLEYILFMKGGFQPFYEGLEVLVEIVRGDDDYHKPKLYQKCTCLPHTHPVLSSWPRK
jgi:hypothetical protein